MIIHGFIDREKCGSCLWYETCDLKCNGCVDYCDKEDFEEEYEFANNDFKYIDKENMGWEDKILVEIHDAFEELDCGDDEFTGDMTGEIGLYDGVWW